MYRPRTFYGLSRMKFNPNPVVLEWGSSTQTNVQENGFASGYDTVETINSLSYYKIASGGRYTSRLAILNFKTTVANLVVTVKVRRTGRSIVCVGNLDSTSNTAYFSKLDKGSTNSDVLDRDVMISVPTAGSHYVKIFIRTEGEGTTSDKANFYLVPFTSSNISFSGASETVEVDSKRKTWNVLSKPTWVTSVNPNTGANTTITVSASHNLGVQRTGDITFRNEKNKDYILQVILKAGTSDLDVSRTNISVDRVATAVSLTITLINNTKWTLTGLPSWITASKSTGVSETITLNVKANTGNSTRNITLTFTGDKGGTKTVTITQDFLVDVCPLQNGCICYHDDYCSNDCPTFKACTWVNQDLCPTNCTCDEGCVCDDDIVICKGYVTKTPGSVCEPLLGGTYCSGNYYDCTSFCDEYSSGTCKPLNGGTVCSGDCYDCQLYCDSHSCTCETGDVISPIPCTSHSCSGYAPGSCSGHSSTKPCTSNSCSGHSSTKPCTSNSCSGHSSTQSCSTHSCNPHSSTSCSCNQECNIPESCTSHSCSGNTPGSCGCNSQACTCNGKCLTDCSCDAKSVCTCDGYSCTCDTVCSDCSTQCSCEGQCGSDSELCVCENQCEVQNGDCPNNKSCPKNTCGCYEIDDGEEEEDF